MEEQLFAAVGSFGCWQKCIFATIFYGTMVGIWQSFAMTFLAPNVPFRCKEENYTEYDQPWTGHCYFNASQGEGLVPCTEFEYDTSEYTDTLVSEWDLVCDREWLISFSKSVYMIGFMASVFIFGQVSDWIGRYPTALICYAIACIGLLAALFSTSMTTFLVFRFIHAFGRSGLTTTGFVLVMETVGPQHRTNVGIAFQLGWSCGLSLLAVIGYFFRHWFWLQVVMAVPLLPLAGAFLFISESPRWLLLKHKLERFEKVVTYAAKQNGKELKEGTLRQLLEMKVEEEHKGTILDLFRTTRMRGMTFNAMYLWMVNAFVYYALSYNTNDMAGNPYLNFLLAGSLEFPSYLMLIPSMRRFGRRPTLVALMILGGIFCLALIAVPSDLTWLKVTLSQGGKFCVTASFGLMYLYTGELFPTVVRSVALGSCSTAARIGSIIAPFSREIGKASHTSVPNVLYFVLAVSSGLFALRLPETSGRRMPDTLQEGEDAFELDERNKKEKLENGST